MNGSTESVPVAASDALAGMVHGPRRCVRVVASSRLAAYLLVEPTGHRDPEHERARPEVLSVVAHDAARQPCSLQLTSRAMSTILADLEPVRSGAVGGGRLAIGPWSLRVARWWRARPVVGPMSPERLAVGVRELASMHAKTAVTAAGLPRLRDALLAGDRRAAQAAVEALIGRGPGTTPDGDDALAGLIAAVSLLGPAVGLRTHELDRYRRVAAYVVGWAAGRTTDVAAGLLAHAARGEVVDDVGAVVTALASGVDPLPAATRLRTLGASSGTALLHGVVVGADLVTRSASGDPTAGRDVVPSASRRVEAA